jgi:hypothetical protein
MTSQKLQQSTEKYAQEFKYWKETAIQFFDIAEKRINTALASGEDDVSIVEAIADAWHKCLTAEWTLFKSGKQTANRMALRRGVDHRQFHPAQIKKKIAGDVDKAVDKALEGK